MLEESLVSCRWPAGTDFQPSPLMGCPLDSLIDLLIRQLQVRCVRAVSPFTAKLQVSSRDRKSNRTMGGFGETLPPTEHASKAVRAGSRRFSGERTFVAGSDGRMRALRFGVKSGGRTMAWAPPANPRSGAPARRYQRSPQPSVLGREGTGPSPRRGARTGPL